MFKDKNRYGGNVKFVWFMTKFILLFVAFIVFVSPLIPWGWISHELGLDAINNPLTGLLDQPTNQPISVPAPTEAPITIPVNVPPQSLTHDNLRPFHYHWIKSSLLGIFDYGLYNPTSDCDCFEMRDGSVVKMDLNSNSVFVMRGGNVIASGQISDLIIIGHTDDTEVKIYNPNDASTNIYYIVGPLPNNAMYLDGNLMPEGTFVIARIIRTANGYILEEHNGVQHTTPWIHGGFIEP